MWGPTICLTDCLAVAERSRSTADVIGLPYTEMFPSTSLRERLKLKRTRSAHRSYLIAHRCFKVRPLRGRKMRGWRLSTGFTRGYWDWAPPGPLLQLSSSLIVAIRFSPAAAKVPYGTRYFLTGQQWLLYCLGKFYSLISFFVTTPSSVINLTK